MTVCLQNLEEEIIIIIFAPKNYHQVNFWPPFFRLVIAFIMWVAGFLSNSVCGTAIMLRHRSHLYL